MSLEKIAKQKYAISFKDISTFECHAVQNDKGSRLFEFQIIDVEEDSIDWNSISLTLSIEIENNKVINSTGTLKDPSNGIYEVTLNSEQLSQYGVKSAQLTLRESEKVIKSKPFNIYIYKSIADNGISGKDITVDFDKIIQFINNIDSKLVEYNRIHTTKIEQYNQNAEEKANEKISQISGSFDTEVEKGKEEIQRHSQEKIEEYNQNTLIKLKEYNDNHDEKVKEIEHAVGVDLTRYYTKEVMDSKLGNLSQLDTENKDNIVMSINEVKSKADKVKTDLQDVLNLKDTIDSKLGQPDIINDLTTGGANKVLSAEQGKVLKEGKADVSHTHKEFTKINSRYNSPNLVNLNHENAYKNLNIEFTVNNEKYISLGNLKIKDLVTQTGDYKLAVSIIMSSNKTHGKFKIQSPGDTTNNWTDQFQTVYFDINKGVNIYNTVVTIPRTFLESKNYEYLYSKLEMRLVITEETKVKIHSIQIKEMPFGILYDIDTMQNEIRLSGLELKNKIVTNDSDGLMSYQDKIKLDGIDTSLYQKKSEMSSYVTREQLSGELGGIKLYENATTETDGLMSHQDKAKLDSINTNLLATKEELNEKANKDTATSSKNGLMSREDKTKLDGINIETLATKENLEQKANNSIATTNSNGLLSSEDKQFIELMRQDRERLINKIDSFLEELG